jgi:PAS domain S-box-containing protein
MWMIPFWASFTECVIEMDSRHIITYIRRKADSSFNTDGILGKSILDIAAESDRELVEHNLDQLKTAAVPYLRFQFMSKTGRYYRWTLVPYYTDDVYSGCHGVIVDVTEQTKKEITLNWQRAVLEESLDFVRIFDLDMHVMYSNPGVYKMTGYANSAEVPPSKQLYTKEHFEAVYGEGLEAVKKHGFWVGRGKLIRADGTVLPIEHTMLSIKDDQGKTIRIATIIKDITVFLEHEKTLEEARLAAEAANVAKSEFLSHMSHEIRTPMNAIIGMINIGMSADDPERKDYCFKKAKDAANHLVELINDVLDMSKIEADKLELSYNVFEFEKAMQNIVSITNVRAEEKQLDFIVNISDEVPVYILCDELRLSQVITNLLSNAMKFTPEKGTVILNVEKTDEAGDDVVLTIEVADTGIGISKEQQDRLFTSFNQANANITQSYGGTGLGLAISKRIVELMGGEIRIESELGKGSKFIFSIQTKKMQAPLSETIGDEHGETFDRSYDFRSHSILIAEDMEINREIMSAVLEVTGISIDYANTGRAAVSMFEKNHEKYDLILMDINMPEMDGYEATRQIRACDLKKARDIPIIAMTANVFKEDIERCITAGMNAHTGKPIDADELFNKLYQYLKAKEPDA